MLEFIIFILPTFTSLIIDDYINNKQNTLYSLVKKIGGYCCLNNLIAMAVVYLYKNGELYINENMQRFDFVFKYFTLACAISMLLPIVIKFIIKNVELKFIFKEVKDEKNC